MKDDVRDDQLNSVLQLGSVTAQSGLQTGLQVAICKVPETVTITNKVFTVACALVEHAVFTDDNFILANSLSSLTLSGTQFNRCINQYNFALCATDISSHGKCLNDCPIQAAETTFIGFSVLSDISEKLRL